jgi:hypothetical protein
VKERNLSVDARVSNTVWHYMCDVSWWSVGIKCFSMSRSFIIELKFALGKVHSHEIADKNNTRDNKNIFLPCF